MIFEQKRGDGSNAASVSKPESSAPAATRPSLDDANPLLNMTIKMVAPSSTPSAPKVIDKLFNENSAPASLALSDRIADRYFEPTKLERWNDALIYRALGVKIFKELVPTGGKKAARELGKKMFNGSSAETLETLKKFDRWSRAVEVSHWIGNGVCLIGVAALASTGSPIATAVGFGINAVVNMYPIALQRFNRIGLQRTIDRLEERLQRRQEKPS